MSHPGFTSAPPATGQQRLVSFPDDVHVEAQRLVYRMSDDGFPIQQVRMVADGLRTVEQVTGRTTTVRVTLAGGCADPCWGCCLVCSGGRFSRALSGRQTFLGLAMGAAWGAALGLLRSLDQWRTSGFSSIRTLQAQRYDVLRGRPHAAQAARPVSQR